MQAKLRETESRLGEALGRMARAESDAQIARTRAQAAEDAANEAVRRGERQALELASERARLVEVAERAEERAGVAEAAAAQAEAVLRSTIAQMMRQTALRQRADRGMVKAEGQLEGGLWEERREEERRQRNERRRAGDDALGRDRREAIGDGARERGLIQEEEENAGLRTELQQTRAAAKRAALEENQLLRMELRRAKSVAKRAEARAAQAMSPSREDGVEEGALGVRVGSAAPRLPSWISNQSTNQSPISGEDITRL
jgi:hypothetical protein